ncbi:MAG: pyridoxine 5'-phosphate synthase, partial [Thermodesulfobacteriota bacterium]
MARLSVNVDHVATVRQARLGAEPDPVTAAMLVELAGADGITVHLREDRRHIQDRDLALLRETVRGFLNLEMAATPEMQKVALSVKPDLVTIVPEKRQELTTEGGVDLRLHRDRDHLKRYVAGLKDAGLRVNLFIDPDPEQIRIAHKL